MLPHQLILPSDFCRHSGHHRIERRRKTSGFGTIEYCVTCSMGYETVLVASDGDEAMADRFVQSMRQ